MYQPQRLGLPEAIELVRRRLKLADGQTDHVRDAIREGALPIYVAGKKADGSLLNAKEVWWPSRYSYTEPEPGQISCHEIHVATGDLDRLWPDPSSVPARRGRGATYDWEGALIELSRLNHVDGIAGRSQADLVRHLQDWFIARGGAAPDAADLKKRVKRFQDALSGGN